MEPSAALSHKSAGHPSGVPEPSSGRSTASAHAGNGGGTSSAAPCPECGQTDRGQTGEYPCPSCGLPRTWDRAVAARGFWTQDGSGNDTCIAITYTTDEATAVWDALRRARSIVMEREHNEDRYKGRFVRGWSEDDGYFYAESPDEDPGSAHRG